MPAQSVSNSWAKTQALIELSRLELARMRQMCIQARDYNEAAWQILGTAAWDPPSEPCRLPAPIPVSLPIARGDRSGWCERAAETRFFAEKIREPEAKRAMLDIAEGFDRLGRANLIPDPAAGVAPGFASAAA
ncbi:MAG: hypothetical protein ACLPPF_04365 [Rhodomicrobium sp.]